MIRCATTPTHRVVEEHDQMDSWMQSHKERKWIHSNSNQSKWIRFASFCLQIHLYRKKKKRTGKRTLFSYYSWTWHSRLEDNLDRASRTSIVECIIETPFGWILFKTKQNRSRRSHREQRNQCFFAFVFAPINWVSTENNSRIILMLIIHSFAWWMWAFFPNSGSFCVFEGNWCWHNEIEQHHHHRLEWSSCSRVYYQHIQNTKYPQQSQQKIANGNDFSTSATAKSRRRNDFKSK